MGSLLKKWDMDLYQVMVLLRLGMKLDFRILGSRYQRMESRASQYAFLWTLFAYSIFSIFFCLLQFYADDLFTFFFILFTYTMVMIGMGVLVEFYSIVIYPDDMEILGHRPVSSTTYYAAKLLNLAFYVTLLDISLCFFPVLSTVFKVKFLIFLAPLIYLVCILAGLTSAFIVIYIYTYLMTKVRFEKLHTILGYLQILFSLALIGGFQAVGFLFGPKYREGFTLSDIPLLKFTPMAWYAGFCDLIYGNITILNQAFSALALLTSFVIAYYGIRRVATSYSHAVALQKEEDSADLTLKEKTSWTHQLGKYITNADMRVGFSLVSLYLKRDRKMRMAILPLFGILILYYFLGVFSQKGPYRIIDIFGVESIQMVFGSITFMFLIPFFSGSAIAMVRYSQDWQASWIYHTTPVQPTHLYNGAVLAVYLWILIPMWLMTTFLFSLNMPVVHALIQTLIIFILADIYAVFNHLLMPHLPLSSPISNYGRQGKYMLVMMVVMVMSFLLVVIEYFAFKTWWTTLLLILLMLGIAVLLHFLENLRLLHVYKEFEYMESSS